MADILGMHQQVDLTIDGNRQFAADNVVTGLHVGGGIESEEVGVAFVNLVRMQTAELAVGAGIAKIESELPGLRLDLQRIGVWRPEVDRGPSVLTQNSEGQ